MSVTPGARTRLWSPGSGLFPCSKRTLSAAFSSAQLLSRYRPRAAVIAVTRSAQAARQAHLCRGVFPLLYREPPVAVWADDVDRRVQFGIEAGEPPRLLPAHPCCWIASPSPHCPRPPEGPRPVLGPLILSVRCTNTQRCSGLHGTCRGGGPRAREVGVLPESAPLQPAPSAWSLA